MNLGDLAWKGYKKGVSRKILGLARGIIEKQIEGLKGFLESPEFGTLHKDLQITFQEEVKDLHKIVGRLESSTFSGESITLEPSEWNSGAESKIKQAIAEAARRLRPLDQEGMLEALQPKKEEKSLPEMSEEKIDELLHVGKTPGAQGKILEILTGLLDEIRKIRASIEAIPKELREIRMVFERIERMGGFK